MTAIADPQLAQCKANLRRANDVRRERLKIIGRAPEKLSPERAAEILEGVPAAVAKMTASAFLDRVARFGRVRVRRTLGTLRIPPDAMLEGDARPYAGKHYLTERQRLLLAEHLRSGRVIV